MAIVAMLICWFAIGKNQKPEKSYLPDTAEKINADFKGKDILSLDQFSVKDINQVLKIAKEMKDITLDAKPSKILALTFTNKAANEMQERIVATLEELEQRKSELEEIAKVTELRKEYLLQHRERILNEFLNVPANPGALYFDTLTPIPNLRRRNFIRLSAVERVKN